jgi:hypothetical protein
MNMLGIVIAELVNTEKSFFPSRMRLDNHLLVLTL